MDSPHVFPDAEHGVDAVSAQSSTRPLTISIVSHRHRDWVERLLLDIARTHSGMIEEVIVTHNLPGPALGGCARPFRLIERHNLKPLGFGANHNRALSSVRTPFVCVLNPDMTLPDAGIWQTLVDAASTPHAGCAFPRLFNPDGSLQDNRRAAPTPLNLLRRRLLRQGDLQVDWVSAAFWVVPLSVYKQLHGFDENYFMYCEDVDFCLRLQLHGYRVVSAAADAIHHAQRSSHRDLRHLRWHLNSLFRLWCSPTLHRYLANRGR